MNLQSIFLTEREKVPSPRPGNLTASLPPGLLAGPEVRLRPGGEDDRVAAVDLGVGQGQGQRGGPADLHAREVVLGTVARALELVLRGVPRHDAAQVRADRVDPPC